MTKVKDFFREFSGKKTYLLYVDSVHHPEHVDETDRKFKHDLLADMIASEVTEFALGHVNSSVLNCSDYTLEGLATQLGVDPNIVLVRDALGRWLDKGHGL